MNLRSLCMTQQDPTHTYQTETQQRPRNGWKSHLLWGMRLAEKQQREIIMEADERKDNPDPEWF